MFDHEPAEPRLTPELEAIERQLARLTPAAPRVDRDRLMYDAGVAAQPRGLGYLAEPSGLGVKRWLWPAATALMTAASLLLATMLVWQRHSYELALHQASAASEQLAAAKTPEVPAIPAIASSEQPLPAATIHNAAWSSYLRPQPGYLGVRDIALKRGVSALETRNLAAAAHHDTTTDDEPTQRDLLHELLPTDRALRPRS
ncbi:MAG: hypothetical protein U0805_22100 [Pirellulales bacterium]